MNATEVDLTAGIPDLDDIIETLHYRLVVSPEPAAAMVAVAHMFARVPDWLDELVAAEPPLRWARHRIVNDQWRQAAGALETAGERMFRQLEMFA